MLLTPSLKPIKPFNPKNEYTLEFYYQGSTQIIKNQLIIQKVSDNAQVYNGTVSTLQFKHPLPSSSLPFGNYKAQVRVGDMNGNWSSYSSWVFFWVLESPSLTVNTIVDGKVLNQTVNFEAAYSHPNSEPLESYRYLLYDNQQNLLTSFSEIFSDGSILLKQEITGLQNDTQYYLELKTISIHGQEYSTGLLPFKPKYITPRLSAALIAENIKTQGSIKLSANILQFIGVATGEYSFIDNEWIHLTNGKVTFEKGFEITQSDFILKIWCRDIIKDKVFLTLYSPNGKLQLMRKGNFVYGYKYLTNVTYPALYISNELPVSEEKEFMIYLRSHRNALDIEQKLVTEVSE